jgi:hypothetical protein
MSVGREGKELGGGHDKENTLIVIFYLYKDTLVPSK